MRKIKRLILISMGVLCLSYMTQAQNNPPADILDFERLVLQLSQTTPGGSARIRGLGGAQTALGGDISNASSNPAGLGFFNRSEFSFTPNFNYSNSKSDYLGRSTSDGKLNFNFANLGVVFNNTKSDIVDSKWRGGNFAISLNRVADFSNSITYQGNSFNELDGNDVLILNPNEPKDIIESAVLNTNVNSSGDISFNNDIAELVFNVFATDIFTDNSGEEFIDRNIYAVDENGNYILDQNDQLIPAYPEPDFPTFQTETIDSRGSSYQASFAYGGNINDRFYFGSSLGILAYNHEVERIYTEQPTGTDLSRLTLEDIFEQSGVGINSTIGIIGRPVNPLLLGISFTTPTFYGIEQLRTISMTAEYPGFFDTEFDEIIYEPFEYSLRTPSKINLGLTYFFGKVGFITHEIEKVNYAGAKLSNASDGLGFGESNQKVDQYLSVYNYRTGIEFRFGKFRARGGAAYMEDPTDDEFDQKQLTVSLGGGLRTKNYYADLSIMNSIIAPETTISPYPGAEVATSTTDRTRVSISVGWFF